MHLGLKTRLLVFADSAFKKEESTGHALKGAVWLRVPFGPLIGTSKCHVIDFVAKRVRHVTRSTFSAELFSLCDAADTAIIIASVSHEQIHGSTYATTARSLREQGGYDMEIELITDAMSVFAATTANHVQMPAEKYLLSRIQFLHELCD